MNKLRLDAAMVSKGLVDTRSRAENYIKLGYVSVDGKQVTKPGTTVQDGSNIKLTMEAQYVSRAGLKLASVAQMLRLNFHDKVVLDVGSSTGGFTDYALQHGARKVIAVEVGTNQLHSSLQNDPRIELHEQTDIRSIKELSETVDIVVIDVSFISLREILPTVAKLTTKQAQVVAMVKPQFEAGSDVKHKGVIKNDKIRRDILKDFEAWTTRHFVIRDKADSTIHGAKGNQERFYLLTRV